MCCSVFIKARKGVSTLGMAAVLLLASGKTAQAQWSPPPSPGDLLKNTVSNLGAGLDPTTNSPTQFATNVLAAPYVAPVAIGMAGAIAASQATVNIMRGQDPNTPPGQTNSTLSNSPSSPSMSKPPSRTNPSVDNGPRLGTSAPGKPLTPSQQSQIAQQPLATKPTLLGNIRRPQAINNSPPLGTSAPGNPLTPGQQHPIAQPSLAQHPSLLGAIRPPSQKQKPIQLASAKHGANNHFPGKHHPSSGHHHSGHHHKGHAGHPHRHG